MGCPLKWLRTMSTSAAAMATYTSLRMNSSGSQLSGPPVVLFLVSQGWRKQAMRATLACFLFMSSLVALGSQATVGVLTTRIILTGLVIAPIAFCGFYLGQKIVRRIEVGLFRRLAVLMVMASGISAIVMELL